MESLPSPRQGISPGTSLTSLLLLSEYPHVMSTVPDVPSGHRLASAAGGPVSEHGGAPLGAGKLAVGCSRAVSSQEMCQGTSADVCSSEEKGVADSTF